MAPSVQRRKVWLTPTTRVPCSNEAKTRNQLKFAALPQTNGSISGASGPKFTILWEHVEEILLLNKFFFRLSIRVHLRRYSPTKLLDGAQVAIFWRVFASCIFSEPRAACFTKKKIDRTRNHRAKHIMAYSLFHRAVMITLNTATLPNFQTLSMKSSSLKMIVVADFGLCSHLA